VSDLWRTATHEAGHLVTATLLHATRDAGPASIEPGKCYNGIAYSGHGLRPTDAKYKLLGAPWPLLPSTVRRYWEMRSMVLFGGQIAADLHAPRGSTAPQLPEPETAQVARSPLPPAQQVTLATAAARDHIDSDTGSALKGLLAIRWDDMDAAHCHAAFLARETELILSAPRASRMVMVLATALLRERTLSARRWKSILRDVQ
jgi:hypothetical protein